mgnify:CR=1 FL=1
MEFEGKEVESVGLIKMDFLGLRTLSIIKDAVTNVKNVHGIDVDIDNIPLDDAPTTRFSAAAIRPACSSSSPPV